MRLRTRVSSVVAQSGLFVCPDHVDPATAGCAHCEHRDRVGSVGDVEFALRTVEHDLASHAHAAAAARLAGAAHTGLTAVTYSAGIAVVTGHVIRGRPAATSAGHADVQLGAAQLATQGAVDRDRVTAAELGIADVVGAGVVVDAAGGLRYGHAAQRGVAGVARAVDAVVAVQWLTHAQADHAVIVDGAEAAVVAGAGARRVHAGAAAQIEVVVGTAVAVVAVRADAAPAQLDPGQRLAAVSVEQLQLRREQTEGRRCKAQLQRSRLTYLQVQLPRIHRIRDSATAGDVHLKPQAELSPVVQGKGQLQLLAHHQLAKAHAGGSDLQTLLQPQRCRVLQRAGGSAATKEERRV